MVDSLLDLVRAVTEATVEGKLEWTCCGVWPEDNDKELSEEDLKPNLLNSIFTSSWDGKNLKVYKDKDKELVYFILENSYIWIKTSGRTLLSLKIPLDNLYFEIFCTLHNTEEVRKDAIRFIEETTLSLLC